MDLKFLLFSGIDYYPSGGANDFVGAYESLDVAIIEQYKNLTKDYEYVKHAYDGIEDYAQLQRSFSWAHIFNIETGEIVWKQSDC